MLRDSRLQIGGAMMGVPRSAVAMLAIGALAACDSSSGLDTRQVSVSFAAQSAAAPATSPMFSPDVLVSEGTNSLVITSAELVIREIELELAGMECAETEGEDDCDELETGPLLVALPVGAAGSAVVETPITVAIPAGSYDELELELHKPSNDTPADLQFLADHPAFADVSVRVRGQYNGQSFEFVSRVNAEAELAFPTPLVVNADGMNMTVNIDLTRWFRDAAGALIDPNTANPGQPNAGIVGENIKASFEVFEDDDHDGRDDESLD